MIKGECTIDGLAIDSLSVHSHAKVIKVCDYCQAETPANLRDVYRGRKKRGTDACFKCSRKQQGEKRRKGNVLIGDGYLADGHGRNRRLLHRVLVEEQIGRPLTDVEKVHHVDGMKTNNSYTNLFLCSNASVHSIVHSSLEVAAFELVRRGYITFCPSTATYEVALPKTTEFSLSFSEIAIKQQKNHLVSRLDAKLGSEIIRGVEVQIPLIAANMSTVIDSKFYTQLVQLGAFAILHRALPIEQRILDIMDVAEQSQWVATAIGIEAWEDVEKLVANGANILVLDVAHGYSTVVIEYGRELKNRFPHVKLVIGNTVNEQMLEEVDGFADAVKVGIAQGAACETATTAGCTEKQFTAVYRLGKVSKRLGLPIISDGSISCPADFVKAIAAGASSAMAGKIFARCPESAAPVVVQDGAVKKVYSGMASRDVQNEWRGGLKAGTCSEGKTILLDEGEKAEALIKRYTGALRSGIAYSGATSIKDLASHAQFVRI